MSGHIKNEFIMEYDTSNLTPASYNPRKINEDSFELLKYSLAKFGIVKPVILNGKNKTLTAGHQRTKACKAIGITKVPCIVIHKDIPMVDEVRFNLFHNSIETNTSKVKITEADSLPFGYSFVTPDRIVQIECRNPEVLKEVNKLVIKYGEWGSVVVDESGAVLQNSEYANAIKNLGYNLLVYKMRNEEANEYIDICTNNEFGQYYYDALGIKAYNQLYCQMNRIAGVSLKSGLYEKVVLKDVKKLDRILDFGAGKCAYINMLKKNGYKAHAYEPHFKKGNKPNIDIKAVVGQIKDIERDVKVNGLYDKVILDSVINSVTSLEFEDMVLTTCNALLKSDGIFYASTRRLEAVQGNEQSSMSRDNVRYTEFLDKNNFSATFRNGVWTMQRFHTIESFKETLLRYFEEVRCVSYDSSAMQFMCKKPRKFTEDKYFKSLDVEFNMEYPNNYRHNMHTKLIEYIIREVNER